MGSRLYRAHQRFRVDAGATVIAPARGAVARGSMLDIGLGGAAFELDTPLRIGEVAEVHLIDGSPIFLTGRVTWVAWAEASAVRLGIRFEADSRAAVTDLLDRLTPTANVGT